MDIFHYLKYGLAIILSFVGLKMLISDIFHIPVGWALAVIGVILLASILLSLHHNKAAKAANLQS